MDEVKRVISYIKSCRDAGIDVTITIDKKRSHLVLNAGLEADDYPNTLKDFVDWLNRSVREN